MSSQHLKSAHQQSVESLMINARQSVPSFPCVPSEEVRKLRAKLIMEESLETVEALGFSVVVLGDHTFNMIPAYEPNLIEIIDGCCDVAVVATGTLSACGVPDVPFQESVNENNLAKFGPGHSFREDGKLVKPPGHKPPDIAGILESINPAVALNNVALMRVANAAGEIERRIREEEPEVWGDEEPLSPRVCIQCHERCDRFLNDRDFTCEFCGYENDTVVRESEVDVVDPVRVKSQSEIIAEQELRIAELEGQLKRQLEDVETWVINVRNANAESQKVYGDARMQEILNGTDGKTSGENLLRVFVKWIPLLAVLISSIVFWYILPRLVQQPREAESIPAKSER